MGASVAAIIVAKEKRIVEKFRQAGATVPEKALTLAFIIAANVVGAGALLWLIQRPG